MKPYDFSGGSYNNMDEIAKWAESSRAGVRRANFGKQSRTRRRLTNVRGRRSNDKAIREGVE